MRDLVETHGEEICLDQRKLWHFYFPFNHIARQEIVVLHAAVREGVAADLAQQVGIALSALAIERFSRRLFDQTGIAMAMNEWAVRAGAHALGKLSESRNRRLHLSAVESIAVQKPFPSLNPNSCSTRSLAIEKPSQI